MPAPSLAAVILDWAGTTVDHGSLAPAGVFLDVFARHGVTVTVAQAREPMGVHKREHVRRMCAMPAVQAAWAAVNGAPPSYDDEEALYAQAVPAQIECLPRYSQVIPGVPQAIAALRARGIKIGSTTGYVRSMLDVVAPLAAAQGYTPDCAIAADEVSVGRPAPFLLWEAAQRLSAWPHHGLVAVGDTVVDMQAGRNAATWCVGVTLTGSLVGLSLAELQALPAEEQQARHEAAAATLREAGAHEVVRSVAELPSAVDALEARLARGERPGG